MFFTHVFSFDLWLLRKIDNLFFIFLPSSVIDFFQYISIYYHFDMISKGLFDLRNLVYFISLIVLFTAGTMRMVEERR